MKKVVIIGGGVSGVCYAINLKKKYNISSTILERNDRILKKMLVSGSGKCNISNKNITPDKYYNEEYVSEIYDYITSEDVNLFLNDLGILLKNDDEGRIYPNNESSSSVVDILLNELNNLDIKVITDFEVVNIKKENKFICYSKNGSSVESDILVVATGSDAYYQKTSRVYEELKKLGHSITKTRPALVPLKVKENVKSFKNIRVKVKASFKNMTLPGEIQFKDDGISGILALDISRYVDINDKIYLDFVPTFSNLELKNFINKSNKSKEDILKGIVPKMIAIDIAKKANNSEDLTNLLKKYPLTISGYYPLENAQVVRGGVKIDEVFMDTMESKIVDNLYILGEVLDVDGACGGYNIHFAISTGLLASLAFEKK